MSYEGHLFFPKSSKFGLNLRKAAKNSEKKINLLR